jgi:hypothetical protein
MSKQQLRDAPASGANGALYEPGEDGEVRGDASRDRWVRPSTYTTAMNHPVAASVFLVAAGAAMAAAINFEWGRR